MPGPKPNLDYIFADMAKLVARLRMRAETSTAHREIHNLESAIEDVKMAFNWVPSETKPYVPPERK